MSVPFDLMILTDIFQQNLITSDKLHVAWDESKHGGLFVWVAEKAKFYLTKPYLVTFKELKKKVVLEATTQQQTKLFERLLNKPFWIWDQHEHNQEDIKTNGDCCFNHIIGLPDKNGQDKPLYDCEKIIFDALIVSSYDTQNGNANSSNNKHSSFSIILLAGAILLQFNKLYNTSFFFTSVMTTTSIELSQLKCRYTRFALKWNN
jgi:hypothetical protein